ncbi:MAG: MFS transporter [Acidimicrobiales bacterium]
MTADGWRPLRRPTRRRPGGRGVRRHPFVRLARVHGLAAASDEAVTAALAGSIFFSISPDESQARVALALLLTMAPFAVVTPLIGPAIDRLRGGRRLMIVITMLARAVLAFLMISHFDTLLLFPEALGILVLQKGYAVSKSAVVPQFVKSDRDFVEANSRLALISSIAGPAGAGVAGVFSVAGGPAAAAALAMVGFIVSTILALQLPAIVVAASPVEQAERAELRDADPARGHVDDGDPGRRRVRHHAPDVRAPRRQGRDRRRPGARPSGLPPRPCEASTSPVILALPPGTSPSSDWKRSAGR